MTTTESYMTLKITNLSHEINDGCEQRQLLNQLSLRINPGQTVALMGDSGCGKTTLLNLIAGLESIQQGDITIDEISLKQLTEKKLSALRKNTLGIIFQQFNLLSGINVQDNIVFSAKLANRFQPRLISTLTETLAISHLLKQMPATLSGGEMQRVAIARALAAQPKLLLADEPTGNLDEKNGNTVVELLATLAKQQNTALLVVTHSMNVARHMDTILRLSDGLLSDITTEIKQ
jgi:putative ABC transport system ATP-binding protein